MFEEREQHYQFEPTLTADEYAAIYRRAYCAPVTIKSTRNHGKPPSPQERDLIQRKLYEYLVRELIKAKRIRSIMSAISARRCA